jgi:hypothetical protein
MRIESMQLSPPLLTGSALHVATDCWSEGRVSAFEPRPEVSVTLTATLEYARA